MLIFAPSVIDIATRADRGNDQGGRGFLEDHPEIPHPQSQRRRTLERRHLVGVRALGCRMIRGATLACLFNDLAASTV